MGGRYLAPLLAAATFIVTACGERQHDAPTAPEFSVTAGCTFNTVSSLVKNEFGANSPQASLATDMKNAGARTDQGTFDGYQILSAVETKYQPGTQASTTNASALAVALLTCMKVGTTTIPAASVFDQALGASGAFAVRGLTNTDNALVASHDNAWVIEPPSGSSWQSILGTGLGASTDARIQYAFLAFGTPGNSSGFTDDIAISSVFNWATLPSATFTGIGAVVGECTQPSNYLQHLAAGTDGVEVLGFIQPTCPPQTLGTRHEAQPRTLAERLLRMFGPDPAYAALLTTTGTGGGKKTFSPFEVIFPGHVVLDALFKWNKSGNTVNVPFSPTPKYQIRSTAGTAFLQEKVLLWLTATNNSGVNVRACNNWAYTDASGVASFTNAFVNKAGGYTITTRSVGATDNSVPDVTLPTVPPSAPLLSPLINVKNGGGNPGCQSFIPKFDANGVLTNPQDAPYPGPNGQ